jgi:hypothetical protein
MVLRAHSPYDLQAAATARDEPDRPIKTARAGARTFACISNDAARRGCSRQGIRVACAQRQMHTACVHRLLLPRARVCDACRVACEGGTITDDARNSCAVFVRLRMRSMAGTAPLPVATKPASAAAPLRTPCGPAPHSLMSAKGAAEQEGAAAPASPPKAPSAPHLRCRQAGQGCHVHQSQQGTRHGAMTARVAPRGVQRLGQDPHQLDTLYQIT